jgi:photolyase PhrII
MQDNFLQRLLNPLPKHLAERVRVLNRRPLDRNGEFVLYWMHHAVRDHENPALDSAIWAADHLQLPVLVYQGLGGRHPYNSDRHHTFILQGARAVARRLDERGISHVFHLAESPDETTPLRGLMSRAALTLTEEFPAPPLKKWTQRLAGFAPTSFWAVDTACILPMQQVQQPFARAFQFRQATWDAYTKRMSRPYEGLRLSVRPFRGDLGFAPVDLAAVDIAACCARCRIDHTVGPVAHTPGGSEAGYDRWERFKRHGLDGYAETRNDAAIAFPSGVSRMSAYLHHGHVSPFRIAREAAASGSKGAAKYLDELLIWRELAHNFCFHQDTPGTIDALPAWARETLAAHGDDPRDQIHAWETTARAQTRDPLWDAAQQSLLIHGELHNNLRMTWGKALLQWTRSPQAALRMMIDLNHRFALDGSDPNSYAGILWCLGLFDRPFTPPRPIIGTLRPRPTRSHAKRLDLTRYAARVSRPAGDAPLQVAVIGAGLSGLVAARALADHGHQVHVFEKARGFGGRMAARRLESGSFDHGAQYFTVRDARFRTWVDSWLQMGVAQRWEGRIGVLHHGAFRDERQCHDRFVAVPGMSALAGHLARGMTVGLSTTIRQIRKTGPRIALIDADGGLWENYDTLIVSTPPLQAAQLLAGQTRLTEPINSVAMTPCWAVMLAYDQPLALPFDGAFVQNSEIAWMARNTSKPERGGDECWVLHASSDWSQVHIGSAPERVITWLSDAFSTAAGLPLPDPKSASAHLWRYAQAQQPLAVECLWDPRSRIGVCGDWSNGSRIEGAFLSGAAMAGRVMAQQTAAAPGWTPLGSAPLGAVTS